MGADPDTTVRSRRRSSRLAMLVGGSFLVVIAAAGWQGRPLFTPPVLEWQDDVELPTQQPVSPPSLPASDNDPVFDLSEIFAPGSVGRIVLFTVLAIVGAVLLSLLLRWLIRRRPRARRGGADVEAIGFSETPSPVVQAPVVRRGIDGALARIDDARPPGDAIVSAWVGLEEAAEDAGRARGVSETPAEFTARILGERVGADDELRILLGLYERVRFGGYDATDADRAAARHSLARMREVWR
ncbi:DUF4129 domain-containing protein [Microbacterium suaedae]|uniref:DUF4129 domain-containing protein n=1 Tax=Microbacterium suaedae TaxID=2067813 RepID=UPI000DA1F264|nr:DUF4129 domain-containing protein [Microbacterium suaedae]